jgi:hypothetical protein
MLKATLEEVLYELSTNPRRPPKPRPPRVNAPNSKYRECPRCCRGIPHFTVPRSLKIVLHPLGESLDTKDQHALNDLGIVHATGSLNELSPIVRTYVKLDEYWSRTHRTITVLCQIISHVSL